MKLHTHQKQTNKQIQAKLGLKNLFFLGNQEICPAAYANNILQTTNEKWLETSNPLNTQL